jgi:serine/threonine-protein kinase
MIALRDIDGAVRTGDTVLGKYQVERVLGRGGMGIVVAARHLQLDELVAIKFLLPETKGNVDAVARFTREARAAVKIRNEHVARVMDVGQLEDGSPYMVMEYLEGTDLAGWLASHGALSPEQAVEFVLQACEAVAEAHAIGIVHRDLKPANLFYMPQANGNFLIKVLDFGISKISSQNPSLRPDMMTQSACVLGSPYYMSPEQIRSASDVDKRSDIWSLGVILFELLTARVPFVATNLPELYLVILNHPPPSVRDYRPELPAVLDQVIQRCLSRDREQRYATVSELASALSSFASKRAQASIERILGTSAVDASDVPRSLAVEPSAGQTSGIQVAAARSAPETTAHRSKQRIALWACAVGAAVLAVIALALHRQSQVSNRLDAAPASTIIQAVPVAVTSLPAPPATPSSPAAMTVSPTAGPSRAPLPIQGSAAASKRTASRVTSSAPLPTQGREATPRRSVYDDME